MAKKLYSIILFLGKIGQYNFNTTLPKKYADEAVRGLVIFYILFLEVKNALNSQWLMENI